MKHPRASGWSAVSKVAGICIAGMSLVSTTPPEEPRAAMGPYTLGMTVEQAREVPSTVTNRTKHSARKPAPSAGHFACAGESNASARLAADVYLHEVGILPCGVHNSANYMDYQILGDGVIVAAEYRFKDDALYWIKGTFSRADLATVTSDLTAKFGPPASSETGEVRDRAGSPFPSQRLGWIIGSDEIVLEAPGLRVDDFRVVYRQRDLDSSLARQIRAARERDGR